MKERPKTAPDYLKLILAGDLKHFTCADIAEMLDIPFRKARAAIEYGIIDETIRISVMYNSTLERPTEYELASWRKEWITKPWK